MNIQAGTETACRPLVMRRARVDESAGFELEQKGRGARKDALDHPRRSTEVPDKTDVVLVAVRADQLLEEGPDGLAEKLRKTSAPIVVLTPILPGPRRKLEGAIGRAVIPAMPNVVGYRDDQNVICYWVPSIASTLLDESGAGEGGELELFARKLTAAGLPARLERDVGSLNASTTVAFYPLIAALAPGGTVDAALANAELLATTLDAAKETDALSRAIGKPAPWASVLSRFIGPLTLKAGVKLARRISPEVVRFVENHFGLKLREQHIAMGQAILSMGADRGMEMPALAKLLGMIRAVG